MVAYVVTPWRVFIGLPFKVPRSIEWVRVKVTPTPDGGAVAELLAKDQSAELAEKDAAYLEKTLISVTQVNLGVLGALLGKQQHRFVQSVSFEAEDDRVVGRVVATPQQLAGLAEAVSGLVQQYSQRPRAPRPRPAPAASGGSAASPAAPAPSPPTPPPPPAPLAP